MNINIHIDGYTRRRHGRSDHGGPVSEHDKNVEVTDLRDAARQIKYREEDEDEIYDEGDELSEEQQLTDSVREPSSLTDEERLAQVRKDVPQPDLTNWSRTAVLKTANALVSKKEEPTMYFPPLTAAQEHEMQVQQQVAIANAQRRQLHPEYE